MAAGCLYILEFEDTRKAADVVYSREKKKEMEERLGLPCKMRLEGGKVEMAVVGEVGEDKFAEAVEDVFKMKVAKKERKERRRSFHCLYYFEVYGEDGVGEKMVEVGRKAKEAIGLEFAVVEEVKGHPAYTYSLSALLHAKDYEDARDIFSYGLDAIRDTIEEATGHPPVNIRRGRINSLSNWPPSIFK